MGYNNHFTGAITITPPLFLADLIDGPDLTDVQLRSADIRTLSEDGNTETVTRRYDAVVPLDMGSYSGHRVVDDIQAVVDHYGKTHAFDGYIQVQWDPGFGKSVPERYVVVDGRVETVTPHLVWPGDGAPANRFTVTWDHDFVNLWCLDCCDADPDCDEADAFAGNPTGMDEILVAMQAHRVERHGEES